MYTLRTPLKNDFYVCPKVRYSVNLPLQMAEYEFNYVRLTKLLLSIEKSQNTGEQQKLKTWRYKIHVVERAPYTTTLQLTQFSGRAPSPSKNERWLQMPVLTVRMYHDAELAEVLAWEGHKRLRPRYDYPNQSMYQSDEKLQVNQFLGEWLKLCIGQGRDIEVGIEFSEK
jgi:uncharacterized protein